ncbi:MAG: DNA polymerase IV [Desulfovibrio sp.]
MAHAPFYMHIDMDAFFASVEQLDNPELRGKPIAVGGDGERGVVSTASYEARKFGVRSALSGVLAKRLCPQLIFVRGRKSRYSEISGQVMAVLGEFSPVVVQASVDEAYLDVTGTENLFGTPEELAAQIKRRVFEETGLTCSVGGAPVPYLAKIASDYHKPAGLTIIHADMVDVFLQELPVGKIPGVGKKTMAILEKEGIVFATDILKKDRAYWVQKLGKGGASLWERANGRDSRELGAPAASKSVSAENTFRKDTLDMEFLDKCLLAHAERIGMDIRKKSMKGRTITVKIKYHDFRQTTRSKSLPHRTCETGEIYEMGRMLLRQQPLRGPVRLIGLGVSGFDSRAQQGTLFQEEDKMSRAEQLDRALDSVRKKFGKKAVQRAGLSEFFKRDS